MMADSLWIGHQTYCEKNMFPGGSVRSLIRGVVEARDGRTLELGQVDKGWMRVSTFLVKLVHLFMVEISFRRYLSLDQS